jgi:hypothetical protein
MMRPAAFPFCPVRVGRRVAGFVIGEIGDAAAGCYAA